MSDVNDRYVIDKTILEDGRLKLIIFDPLQWDCVIREQHSYILQNKLNDYLAFIKSGQISEHFDKKLYTTERRNLRFGMDTSAIRRG